MQKTKHDIIPLIYNVEHLASFAVDKNLETLKSEDGIKKLKEMIKNNAICAQQMVLKVLPDRILINEINGVIFNFILNFILKYTLEFC